MMMTTSRGGGIKSRIKAHKVITNRAKNTGEIDSEHLVNFENFGDTNSFKENAPF